MKVAMTVWEDSLSTVCDFCSSLLIVEIADMAVRGRVLLPFAGEMWPSRVNQLGKLGVEVLLCGAISRLLERTIRAAGIQVIPCLRGSVDEVIRAYLEDGLGEARFLLPGFHPEEDGRSGRRRRGRHGCIPSASTRTTVEEGRQRGVSSREILGKQERRNKMKVAITAVGEGIDSPVDPVFGRSKQFIITDPEGSQVEVVENSQNVNAAQGAGIQAARLISDRAVGVLITGNVGPNAFRSLGAASIRVYQFAADTKTVRDALEAWKAGRLAEATAPTAKGHRF
jgi:predicted Fe-Mo cluster-binding NifX family protein